MTNVLRDHDRTTGGAAVVDALRAQGVRDVFGIPGTHSLEIYRHLAGSGIRHVLPRHEQGAGYAADGYARTSGRPGVLVTTSGPGITNAVTALATSYADSVPVLAVSPGPVRGTVGADIGWLHEMRDQQATVGSVCARSLRVESADEIPEALADLFDGFRTTRPRPVHLEVPVDVLEGSWSRRPCPVRAPGPPPGPAVETVARVARLLGAAARPLLLAGGGARGAATELAALLDLGIPVLTTVNGKGVVDEAHPGALGASVRLPEAHAVLDEADVLLVVGSELGDSDLWGGVVAPGGAGRLVVRVDIDPGQLHKNLPADLPVHSDAAVFLAALADRLRAAGVVRQPDPGLRARVLAGAERDAGPWARIQHELRAVVPPDAVVAGDSSQVTYYGTVHHWPMTPAHRLLYPTGYATLGYGLPAAIGAKVAAPERAVVAVVGDGAVMFTVQELMTAVELGLSLPVVVVDNGGYAEIREQMLERSIPPLAVDLTAPDFAALARAFGARGVRAAGVDELGALVGAALDAPGPTLIHLTV
ncbi:thiamine pyrophosphate-binding protein [Nocardioides nitrophenolicus]|uniref:thiamine pyrophosphate-binding protein n=1 Tax=Nocardioides nitrophenolicus TaxID=60489 RepID=UPI0027DE1EDF|nr:thiamine pyrophosphate-binding protein [Nocardioides nitrophenolicus]MBM7519937.1 acetolactate synthase-1/2/3 large subunit [Nocardioides nitrophenolicus]